MSTSSFPRAGCCSQDLNEGRSDNGMAGRIRSEDVEAGRERTDIAAIVSGYLQLKKAGRDNLTGLCPFHAEKTPSFSVSPSKQLFHRPGCGEGGTGFTFLHKLENRAV